MRLKIKRKNVQRLASLSALGVGAMGLAAGTAEASIVVTDVNQTVWASRALRARFKLNLERWVRGAFLLPVLLL
jgi:hypothetical protein